MEIFLLKKKQDINKKNIVACMFSYIYIYLFLFYYRSGFTEFFVVSIKSYLFLNVLTFHHFWRSDLPSVSTMYYIYLPFTKTNK